MQYAFWLTLVQNMCIFTICAHNLWSFVFIVYLRIIQYFIVFSFQCECNIIWISNSFTSMWIFASTVLRKTMCCPAGKLGHGDTNRVYKPKVVEALQGMFIRKVCAGSQSSLALTSTGQVRRHFCIVAEKEFSFAFLPTAGWTLTVMYVIVRTCYVTCSRSSFKIERTDC